jgi:hypothetical protein
MATEVAYFYALVPDVAQIDLLRLTLLWPALDGNSIDAWHPQTESPGRHGSLITESRDWTSLEM